MNKFYEFTKPYAAIVAAPDVETATGIYHDEVCEPCPDELPPKELTKKEARAAWDARGNPDESPEDFEVYMKEDNVCAMLIDGNLI